MKTLLPITLLVVLVVIPVGGFGFIWLKSHQAMNRAKKARKKFHS